MAKKAKTATPTKNDMDELADWLEDEIHSVKDEAAVAILELLKGEEADRITQANNRIEECKAHVAELQKLLDWAADEESEDHL